MIKHIEATHGEGNAQAQTEFWARMKEIKAKPKRQKAKTRPEVLRVHGQVWKNLPYDRITKRLG